MQQEGCSYCVLNVDLKKSPELKKGHQSSLSGWAQTSKFDLHFMEVVIWWHRIIFVSFSIDVYIV